MPGKGQKWTPEQRKAASDRAKAAIAAKASEPTDRLEAMAAIDDIIRDAEPFDGQCIYCSLEFKTEENLFKHQQAMHGGDMPQDEPVLPIGADKLPAGSTVRTRNVDGSAGIPLKTHWPKAMLENGWECDDPGDRVPDQGGWRYIPAEGELDPRCQRCGGPMHKLSQMIWYDVPTNAPPVVVWQGLTYHMALGEENHLPDIIVGQIRQSMNATKAAVIKPSSQVADGEVGRLNMTGFLPDLETEEATA